jgi:hypothetical protein
MHAFRRLAFLVLFLVAFVFSCKPQAPPATEAGMTAQTEVNAIRVALLPPVFVERFRLRSTSAEIREFEELASRDDSDSQMRTVEMIFFKLTGAELAKVGISQTEQAGEMIWNLAFSGDSAEDKNAIYVSLENVAPSLWCGINHRRVAWYVVRTEFFKARQALLDSESVRALKIIIVSPDLERAVPPL